MSHKKVFKNKATFFREIAITPKHDKKMKGIIFGYRIALTTDEDCHIYYFGRTKQKYLLEQDYSVHETDPKDNSRLNREMCHLLQRVGRKGLHKAGKIILWKKSDFIHQDFKMFLNRLREKIWITSEGRIGKHWFSSIHAPSLLQVFVEHTYKSVTGNGKVSAPNCLLMY